MQEEAAIFKIPCLVIREKTERPETIMSGSAKLVHNDYVKIKKNMKFFIKTKHVTKRIPEYDVKNVSSRILGILKKY